MKKNETKSLLELSKKNKREVKSYNQATLLDDYNNYMKEYLKHYKKSLKGNSVSLAKYPYLKAKSEMLRKKLIVAYKKELLTEKQLHKFWKIQLKIFNTCC